MATTTAIAVASSPPGEVEGAPNKLPSTVGTKVSIPSRQPHIGAQATKRMGRCGIKDQKLYDYCLYAMKEVKKVRTEKSGPSQVPGPSRKTVGSVPLAKPHYCQSKIEKLQAKILLDDDCGIEIEETVAPRKKQSTRNCADQPSRSTHPKKRLRDSAAAAVSQRAKRTGSDNIQIFVKPPPVEKRNNKARNEADPEGNDDSNHNKVAQRTNLGIRVDDKEFNGASNGGVNINMNLTSNLTMGTALDKERALQQQQQQVQNPSPYFVAGSPAQYWSQASSQPLPLYGLVPGYGYSMQYPPQSVVYPMMYNTQAGGILPLQSYAPAVYQTNVQAEPLPVVPAMPPAAETSSPRATATMKHVEASTNTDCLISDLSGIVPCGDSNSHCNNTLLAASKDENVAKDQKGEEQSPRDDPELFAESLKGELQDLSVDILPPSSQAQTHPVSSMVTPKNAELRASPRAGTVSNGKCSRLSQSRPDSFFVFVRPA